MHNTIFDNSFKKRFSFILGISISLICLAWLFSSIEVESIVSHIQSANYNFLFFAFVVTGLSYLLRSLRWIYFFDKSAPSFANSFCGLMYGFFMNNILPARMGELVRAHVGGRLTGLSRAHVLATIAAERLADGLVISLFFALCYLSSAKQVYHHQGLLYVSYIFLFVALLTAFFLWQQRLIFRLLDSLSNMMPGQLSKYSLQRVQLFMEGLTPLFEIKRFLLLAFLSILVWSIELLVYYQVSQAFNTNLSLAELSIFLVAVNFSSLIPAAPGGIGVIEAFATFILTQVGINKETAFAMVASQHIIQIVVVGIAGAYVQFKYFGRTIPVTDRQSDG